MADGTVGVAQASTPDRLIDNEVVTNDAAQTVYRQKVSSPVLDNRYRGGKTPVVATVTASGDTTVYAPASGKALRVYWVSAKPAPDASSFPLIRVLLGAVELYRDWAIQHWELFTGAVNAALVVNLSAAGSIPVTAHIEEFTP